MRFAGVRRRPAWTYSTRGVLWRLQTGSPEFLVGEDRIPDAKTVSYFCLDRVTGIPRWEGFALREGWWSGVEAVAAGVVLFHGFASPDLPLHSGLTAVALASGSILWSRPAIRLLRVEARSVLVARGWPGGDVVERLDGETGAVLEGGISVRPSAVITDDFPMELPRPLVEAEVVDPGLLAALGRVVPESVRRESVLFAHDGRSCVVSFSEPLSPVSGGERASRSMLVVLGGPRWEEVFSDVIQPAAVAVTPEPFFCQNGVLYFVRERSTLVAVPLRNR